MHGDVLLKDPNSPSGARIGTAKHIMRKAPGKIRRGLRQGYTVFCAEAAGIMALFAPVLPAAMAPARSIAVTTMLGSVLQLTSDRKNFRPFF